ncbi:MULTISPECIES: hypothetical protein [Pseudomonas]|uniref:hypothetical protein n=1 Tax=unclassified Pseudomonas TaxID=196821 RepID=UPI0039B74FCF
MSNNAARGSIFLIMATAIGQPPVPLRAFQGRAQAEEWQADLIDYHISVPECPVDIESWEDYDAQLKAWQRGHPGGIAVAGYRMFELHEVPLHGALMPDNSGIEDQPK